MPRSARSRSADGATIAALLPPSSRIDRPNRAATTGADLAAHRSRTGGRHDRHTVVGDQCRADLARRPARPAPGRPARRRRRRPARTAPAQASAVSGVLSDGFQITGSPRDERQRGVPRPHRDREVERGDHTDRPHRLPGLHHPVAGTLRWRSSGRAAGATGRRRSRRCRSSPAPRRGLRSGSCRPRSTTSSPSSSLCSRSSSPSRRTTLPRTGAGVSRHTSNAEVARSTASSTSPAAPAEPE